MINAELKAVSSAAARKAALIGPVRRESGYGLIRLRV